MHVWQANMSLHPLPLSSWNDLPVGVAVRTYRVSRQWDAAIGAAARQYGSCTIRLGCTVGEIFPHRELPHPALPCPAPVGGAVPA